LIRDAGAELVAAAGQYRRAQRRSLAQYFFDQPRLADPCFALNQRQAPLPAAGPLPPGQERCVFRAAANKGEFDGLVDR
jgi:hypothetical protein